MKEQIPVNNYLYLYFFLSFNLQKSSLDCSFINDTSWLILLLIDCKVLLFFYNFQVSFLKLEPGPDPDLELLNLLAGSGINHSGFTIY